MGASLAEGRREACARINTALRPSPNVGTLSVISVSAIPAFRERKGLQR